MMKRIFCFLVLLSVGLATWAAKADPEPYVFVQPDGTSLTVREVGDENDGFLITMDGVLLVAEKGGIYVARVDADAQLISSGILAHEPSLRTEAERKEADAQPRQLFFEGFEKRSAEMRRAVKVVDGYFPHTGSPRILTVLVEYQDSVFRVENPHEVFDSYLNAECLDTTLAGGTLARNYCSVGQYFREVSFGKFSPQFDVVGPIRLPGKISELYGVGRNDNISALVRDALPLLPDSLDLSIYDIDGDSKIDLICFISASYSSTGNSGYLNETIWPKFTTVNILYKNDLRVGNVCIACELAGKVGQYKEPHVAGIGLFTHEFSHTMGMPDLYATTSPATYLNQTYEYWDLMDGGEHQDNGFCPIAYSAVEREAMGWMEIETLSEPAYIEMAPIDEPGGKAYRIYPDPADSIHNYVLENLQPIKMNSKIFGHGMLVHNVNLTAPMGRPSIPNNGYETEYDDDDTPIAYYSHPIMNILPADGFVHISYMLNEPIYDGDEKTVSYTTDYYVNSLRGDLYPGTGGVTSLPQTIKDIWKDIQKRKYFWTTKQGYDGPPVTDITEDENGTIRFSFDGGVPTEVKAVRLAHDGVMHDLLGRPVGIGFKGIAVMDGKKILVK